MTTKIYDARRECNFRNREIVFDTNIWIYISGFDPSSRGAMYSNYYKDALDKGNRIIVSDYIVSEFFNRACKIEYGLHYPNKDKRPQFKVVRSSDDFSEFIGSVRDTCLNLLDDCVCDPAFHHGSAMSSHVEEAGKGLLDMSDIIIREHCKRRGYVLVSHDSDFRNCGLELVTANARLLSP